MPKEIFVSYAHEDWTLCEKVYKHLTTLPSASIWIDRGNIRAGDTWQTEIENALSRADLTVLLVSPSFLRSRFIRTEEVPRLQERNRDNQLRIVPFLLRPCAWEQQSWLKELQMVRPAGEALSELAARGESAVDAALAQLTNEIGELLGIDRRSQPPRPQRSSRAEGRGRSAAIELIGKTVFRNLGVEATTLARATVTALAADIGHSNVLDAARFYVEFCLLQMRSVFLDGQPVDTVAKLYVDRFWKEWGKFLRSGQRVDPMIVSPRFFTRARENEEEWKNYFDVLTSLPGVEIERERIATLCRIQPIGFIAAQYLIAGLLSRFEDDWEPVLNAYTARIPAAINSSGAFESLQASQWNCWLVWGPSIPFCTCSEWHGVCAFQYGYGDENNSLPAIELPTGEPTESHLDKLACEGQKLGRQAVVTSLIGRLRWGPWVLNEGGEEQAAQIPVSPFQRFEQLYAPEPKLIGAPAQRALFTETSHLHRQADGLLFEVEEVFRPPRVFQDAANAHVYFSAYRWVIFLVALRDPAEGGVGPKLLAHKQYPPWPEDEIGRQRVRDARLWEHLVPVFVHANIADPPALRFQTQALAESSLSLLRQIWTERHKVFTPGDVAAGICFYMVSSFDYSGCGRPLRYPPEESLRGLLQERLNQDGDREFARAVVLPPPDESEATRAWGLRGFFSACHLPELVADYYEAVEKDKKPRASRSTLV